MGRSTRARVSAWAAAVLLVLAPACVGPSRSDRDYRRKAAESAQAMVSTVETARLAAEVAADGRGAPPYIAVVMRESETAAQSIVTSFSVVQPPSESARRLRREVLTVLEQASSSIGELRIAAYRAELETMPEVSKPLDDLVGKLRRVMDLAPT